MSQATRESTNLIESEVEYPMTASISRIYVPVDTVVRDHYSSTTEEIEGRARNQHPVEVAVSKNRKYISALENMIKFPDDLQPGNFDNYKLGETNMICVPNIFCGTGLKKGSVKLDYYIAGSLIASATDKNSDGKIWCTTGVDSVKDTQIGTILLLLSKSL